MVSFYEFGESEISQDSQDVVLRSWNDILTVEVHVETNIIQFLIYYRRSANDPNSHKQAHIEVRLHPPPNHGLAS